MTLANRSTADVIHANSPVLPLRYTQNSGTRHVTAKEHIENLWGRPSRGAVVAWDVTLCVMYEAINAARDSTRDGVLNDQILANNASTQYLISTSTH